MAIKHTTSVLSLVVLSACSIEQEPVLADTASPAVSLPEFPGYTHGDNSSASEEPPDPPLPGLAETPSGGDERAIAACTTAPAGSFNVNVTVNGVIGGNHPWIFGSNFSGYTGYEHGITTWNTVNGIRSEDLALLKSRLLRTPGGCISESYFWDEQDGNGATLIKMDNRTIPSLSLPEMQSIVDDAAIAQGSWFDHLHTLNLSFDANLAAYNTPCGDGPIGPISITRAVNNLVGDNPDISLYQLGNEPWGEWSIADYDDAARDAARELTATNWRPGIIGVGFPSTQYHLPGSPGATRRDDWNEMVTDMYQEGVIDYVSDHPYMKTGLRMDPNNELARLRTLFLEENRSTTGERYCMVDAKYGPAYGTCDAFAGSTVSLSPTAIAATEFRRQNNAQRWLFKMSVLSNGSQVSWSTCPLNNGTPGLCSAPVTTALSPAIPNLEVAGFEDPVTGHPKLMMLRARLNGANRVLEGRICAPAAAGLIPFSACNSTWEHLMNLPANVDSRLGYAAYIREQHDGKPRLVLVFLSNQDRTLVRGCNLSVDANAPMDYALDCGGWADQVTAQDEWYLPPSGRDRLLDLSAWVGHMPYDGYPELPEWGAAAWMAVDNVPRVISGWNNLGVPSHRLAFTEWNINWDRSQVSETMSHNMFIFETLMTMAKRNVPIGVFHFLGRDGGCCGLFEDDPNSGDPMDLRLSGPGRAFSLAAGMAGHEARATTTTVEHRAMPGAPGCAREDLGCLSGSSLPLVSVHAGRAWANGDAVLMISNRDRTRSASLEVDLRALNGFEVPQEDMVIEQRSLYADNFSSKVLLEDNRDCRLPTGTLGAGRIKLHVKPMSITLVRVTVKRRWTAQIAPSCANGHTPVARPVYVSWTRFPEPWRTTYSANGSIALPTSSADATDHIYVMVADAATGAALTFRPPPPPGVVYGTAYNPPTPMAHWNTEDLDDGTYAMNYYALPVACP